MKDIDNTGDEVRRLLILALAVAGLVLVLHFTPLNQWLGDLQALKQQIRAYGWKAHAVFAAGTIAAIALGVPRLALCALAGALFGFVAGGSSRWSRASPDPGAHS